MFTWSLGPQLQWAPSFHIRLRLQQMHTPMIFKVAKIMAQYYPKALRTHMLKFWAQRPRYLGMLSHFELLEKKSIGSVGSIVLGFFGGPGRPRQHPCLFSFKPWNKRGLFPKKSERGLHGNYAARGSEYPNMIPIMVQVPK